jgi:DNA-binding LytR/AlgR family response regulator
VQRTGLPRLLWCGARLPGPLPGERESEAPIMHLLVVDDEPLAQMASTNILTDRREVEGFDTANGTVAALDKRIEDALDIVFRRSAGQQAVRLVETLPHLQRLAPQKREKIAIKANGRVLFIAPEDVVAVHAEGNYVVLQAHAGSHLLRVSISSIAEKLRPYGFLRIHRSVLVNASFVEELQALPTGEYTLRIKGGKEYTVTRTYKSNLKDLAACWIGFDGFVE